MEAATAEPHQHEHAHERRRVAPGLIALTALVAPVAFVGLAFSAGDADHGGYVCPLREATGVPCPACGATRAFFHFANGDTAFLHYNWAWPLMWLVAVGFALVVVRRGWRREPLLGERVRKAWHGLESWSMKRVVATPFVLLAPAWIVALSNLHNINTT